MIRPKFDIFPLTGGCSDNLDTFRFFFKNNFTFVHQENFFVTPCTIFLVPRTPTHCSVYYRFRGSPSLITPHLLLISNYASASPFWKSTGSYRFPNIALCLTNCASRTPVNGSDCTFKSSRIDASNLLR